MVKSDRLLGAKIYARDCKRSKQAPGTRNREPIEQKESYRWIESYNLTKQSQEELNTGAESVNVGDREADIYELLKEASLHQEQGIGFPWRLLLRRAPLYQALPATWAGL